MSDVVFRGTTPADLEQIMAHRRAMFRDDGFTDPAVLDDVVANSRPFLARMLAEGKYRGWFALADKEVVAGVGLLISDWAAHPAAPRDPRRAYVLNVYTKPGFRGRGLATTLMRRVVDHCRAAGFTAVWLHATDAGERVYRKLGFERTNEMRLKLG
jgi:ribosomal protein S18 acetylase RimI-like enzyme